MVRVKNLYKNRMCNQWDNWRAYGHLAMKHLKGPCPVTNLMISPMLHLSHVLIFSHGVALGSHFLVCFPYSGQAAHSSHL